jgi:hypothetical protein
MRTKPIFSGQFWRVEIQEIMSPYGIQATISSTRMALVIRNFLHLSSCVRSSATYNLLVLTSKYPILDLPTHAS